MSLPVFEPDESKVPRMSEPKVHNASTYSNRGCRCDKCRAANVRLTQQARARRASQPLPEGRQHGVYTTYANYGCRCDLCRAANTQRKQ